MAHAKTLAEPRWEEDTRCRAFVAVVRDASREQPTLEEVGWVLGLSAERVRQLEESALEKVADQLGVTPEQARALLLHMGGYEQLEHESNWDDTVYCVSPDEGDE